MKIIVAFGRTFEVAESVKYITQDSSGLILAHKHKPKEIYDDSSGTTYWHSKLEPKELYFPSSKCIEL